MCWSSRAPIDRDFVSIGHALARAREDPRTGKVR